jgi:hypothetical protein
MATFNALMLGTIMYKSGLVPRVIPAVGLIGAPLLFAANVATMFGYNEQTSTVTMVATLPIAFWELGVGFYLTFKGFRPSPVTAASPRSTDRTARPTQPRPPARLDPRSVAPASRPPDRRKHLEDP